MTLSTHVLDVGAGRPAQGVPVQASLRTAGGWQLIAEGSTDADGRVSPLVAAGHWRAGLWQLSFAVGDYLGPDALFPRFTLEIAAPSADRLHIPLLLNRFGMTTYRGS